MNYDEKEIVTKINSLECLAIEEIRKDTSITFIDLHLRSAIDKSIKLIDTFLFAFGQQNITVLTALTRIQMDCVLRTYATTIVADGEIFCKKIMFSETQVNKNKDISGNKLTDKYLCESIGAKLNLPIYELYQKVSGYVHLSSSSFHNIVRPEKTGCISMLIGKQNRQEDILTNKRLSLELANHFYFFGEMLITVFLRSWIKQKIDERLD